jgi:predicted HicB family RNase H-like nuclease
MKKYTATIATRVTPETRDRLLAEARRRKVRLTDVVREKLEEKAR